MLQVGYRESIINENFGKFQFIISKMRKSNVNSLFTFFVLCYIIKKVANTYFRRDI